MANPEWDNYKTPEKRHRLVSDNDGHEYVIVVGEEDRFYTWVAATESGEDYEWDFEDARVDGRLTFTNPRCI
jgi:hypothetical protein